MIPGNEPVRGFSLLELVVASAILSILGLILASMTHSLAGLWQQGIAHNDHRAIARTIFGRIGQDLRIAARPEDCSVYSAPATTDRTRLVINPTGLSATYKLPQALFWEAPVATSTGKGDLAWTGYFIQWVNDGTAAAPKNIPKFCQLRINPDSPGYVTPKPATWITDSLLAANAPAARASGFRGQLAENVLGFWVQPLDQKGDPISTVATGSTPVAGSFDTAQGYKVTWPGSSATSYSAALPSSIEIVIVTIDSRAAKQLTGAASEKPAAVAGAMWTNVGAFVEGLPPVLRKGVQVQSTIIDLVNAPR